MTNAVRPPIVVPPRASRLPAFLGYWVAYGAMVVLPTVLFAYALAEWVPQVRDLYMDFKAPLPPLTQWVVATSATVSTLGFWVEVMLAAGLISVVFAGITALMPRGFIRAAIAMGTMLVILSFTVVESLTLYGAIWDPLLKVMNVVQGKGP